MADAPRTVCITEGQRRWHLFGETVAMLVAVPFSVYLATRKQLPLWARGTAATIGAVTLVLDLTSIVRYTREFRVPAEGTFGQVPVGAVFAAPYTYHLRRRG